jgi:DNA-binding NarL/FixJ family response regulator
MTTTVVLTEDSYLMREALVFLLGTLDDVELVAVCETYDHLIETVEQLRPAVVITDIRMPPTQTDEGIRAAYQSVTITPTPESSCSVSTSNRNTR